ncbi:hypothetical protein PMZ80_003945 [Knufia obscura]|uniref:GH16 domain-containing protein n=1 Tax=Knufia obscura TaxID=1635080 RepID=A0ABR0RQP3_9EURO|nr:hypothetical protein PMZ80_003945 [Knufia obscura]
MASRTPFHQSQTSANDNIGFVSGTATPSVYSEKRNPFDTPVDTPYGSYPVSATTSQLTVNRGGIASYFHSRRVKKGEVDKPWLSSKDPKEKWITIIPMIGILVGLGLGALLVWDGLKTVVNHKYCSVYSTDFANGLDEDAWTKEAEVGGFGNGQFEQTTITDENIFIRDGMMVIRPTLQDESLITSDSVINLTAEGICSSTEWNNCVTSTNTTNGTIVQPVKSGRINLKNKAIKYGRIEVEAQLPSGDWLWPAIWMLPVEAKYGPWPLSGEIDILESRGNDHNYAQGGDNIYSSALHWGPDPANDAWWRTNSKRSSLHDTFAEKFHTFGLEWSEKYLFTYLDSRLLQVMYVNFAANEGLWARGDFPLSDSNGTRLIDPWSQTGQPSTPFDQDFYLIINLAVGSENGWFQDGQSQKPWVDGSPTAKKDFWNARDKWQKSWDEGNPELQVRAVRVWQQQGFNGCDAGVSL